MRSAAQLLVLGLTLASCAEPLRPATASLDTQSLEGRWVSAPSDVGSHGSHQEELVLEAGGRFASVARSYGLYEGQERDALSTVTRIEGTYRIDGDRLHFRPTRLIWWDQFEGRASAAPKDEPYPWESLFENARYVSTGESLVMRYTVSPADTPLPVLAEYSRVR